MNFHFKLVPFFHSHLLSLGNTYSNIYMWEQFQIFLDEFDDEEKKNYILHILFIPWRNTKYLVALSTYVCWQNFIIRMPIFKNFFSTRFLLLLNKINFIHSWHSIHFAWHSIHLMTFFVWIPTWIGKNMMEI